MSVITSQLFSLKYTLASKTSSQIGTGAIAGIAVGGAVAIGLILAAIIMLIRRRRAKARSEREAATMKSPRANTFEADSSHIGSPMTELPSPGFPPPGRRAPLSWAGHEPLTPVTPSQPEGGAELPAAETPPKSPPVELTGDTFLNEHHPAHSPPHSPPLRVTHPTSEEDTDFAHDPKRDTIASITESESSPVYSPIGGSALLPDSPHLNAAFRPTDRPISGAPSSRPTSQDFPESPLSGSVRERVEELERSRSPS